MGVPVVLPLGAVGPGEERVLNTEVQGLSGTEAAWEVSPQPPRDRGEQAEGR